MHGSSVFAEHFHSIFFSSSIALIINGRSVPLRWWGQRKGVVVRPTLDNANNTVNSLEYNKSNDIPVPMDCETRIHYIQFFISNKWTIQYTCELCTRPNQIQRERIASGNSLS